MKSVVIGGGGFLGFSIVKKLIARGDEVLVIGRNSYEKVKQIGAESLAIDIQERAALAEALEGAQEVYHTAAKVDMWGDYQDFYKINVLGTQNVIHACKQNAVPKLIYTSSPSVVFDGTDQLGLDESCAYPKKYLAHYPATKSIAERAVIAANNNNDFFTVSLRPHLMWGPNDPHLTHKILELGKTGRFKILGKGQNKVDTIFIENAAEAHLAASKCLGKDQKCNGKIYFLGQNEPVNAWDFINEMLERAGEKPIRKKINANFAYAISSLVEAIYRMGKIKSEPPITRFMVKALSRSHYYSHKSAKTDFGFNPNISIEQGLELTFKNPTQK